MDDVEKLPPQNLEAEICVLGSIVLNADALDVVEPILKAADFYNGNNRTIFEACRELREKTGMVDLLTLTDALRGAGTLEEIGGAPYLVELADAVPAPSRAAHYAAIVARDAYRRRVLDAAQAIRELALDGTLSGPELQERAEAVVFKIDGQADGAEEIHIGPAARAAFERIGRPGAAGISTGLPGLDRFLGGLRPGQLIVIGGRPSVGKTSFALNLVARHIQDSLKVLFFSAEMTRAELAQNLICLLGGLESGLWRIQLTGDGPCEIAPELDAAKEAMESLEWSHLHIDDRTNSLERICARARRMKRKNGLDAVYADHLQLLTGPDSESRRIEIGSISRGLKLLAKELEIPVVLTSQLNRAIEKRENKMPIMSDLKESGDVEQDADAILFLHRPDFFTDERLTEGNGEIIVCKNRNGRVGRLPFFFDMSRFKIGELDRRRELAHVE